MFPLCGSFLVNKGEHETTEGRLLPYDVGCLDTGPIEEEDLELDETGHPNMDIVVLLEKVPQVRKHFSLLLPLERAEVGRIQRLIPGMRSPREISISYRITRSRLISSPRAGRSAISSQNHVFLMYGARAWASV
ncbi:uncharacterized protein LOC112340940 [Selaginella moellendorffii]|uniref:uncharacterized protein LOC112340940 n=1 Tax=Selaginella moellendorffii TaxID=88036 RepID=UPI000D1CCAA0|nr:uncharacterized protein LOC112340940 [Selaginella moellendorffii]|eukprot:XP_024515970.1 uncharacterized protein LOC112340940 [Selaginella moellendorffii]